MRSIKRRIRSPRTAAENVVGKRQSRIVGIIVTQIEIHARAVKAVFLVRRIDIFMDRRDVGIIPE